MSTKIRWVLGAVGALLLVLGTARLAQQAEPEPKPASAKEKDIRKLMEITGAGKMGAQMVENMVKSMKIAMPNVPEKFWDEFLKEANPEQLVDMVVPVYDKHLEHEDIKGMIAFYESPVGKKFLAAQPQILKESMEAGQKWGRELGAKIVKKLQAQGYN